MEKPFQIKHRIYEFAPAKINLALHVTGQLKNGYHSLSSLVAFVNIGDNISVKTADKDRLKVTGPFASDLNNENDNLILQALRAFREKFPNSLPTGLKFELEKNLPIASGIGGGSSDAGASLRLLAKISDSKISCSELQKIALKLGADVPVCLSAKPSVMSGVGEKIAPIAPLPNTYIVLINPLINISTQKIFSQIKNVKNLPLSKIEKPFKNVEDLANWLQITRNDLLEPALKHAPIIGELINIIKTTRGCHFARMSGSGATIFALYSNQQDAQQAVKRMQQKYKDFWIKLGKLI